MKQAIHNNGIFKYLKRLYVDGSWMMSSKPPERPVSTALHVCIYTSQLCSMGFLKAVYISYWLAYFQVILIKLFFWLYIYTVEKSFKCNQEVICQVQCSPNVQTRARLQKKIVTFGITLNMKQTPFSGQVCYFYTFF